ncbi:hypothetical protein ATZ36_13575 [Candidatus Endomicrobiellum trichonymphae]|uniref:Uncharacterized protein n=1 Tax=Endomicrobium trichonymphae TaxID=1408204 RepID=A0A1E5IMF3_ENDTX|nr:hypothetical protein ATZ36_13575 [Candidatus Endomicrobium trichonymphae]
MKIKKKFVTLKRIQDFEIEFIQANKKDFKNLPAFVSFGSKTASLANYYRLLITEILPNNVEKAIYLNYDIIVNKDISELWNISVDNYLAGCVNLGNNYFNSGVMLLNLYELRNFNFYNKWKKYVEDNLDKIDCYDQSILNTVMGHNVLFLPGKLESVLQKL